MYRGYEACLTGGKYLVNIIPYETNIDNNERPLSHNTALMIYKEYIYLCFVLSNYS